MPDFLPIFKNKYIKLFLKHIHKYFFYSYLDLKSGMVIKLHLNCTFWYTW